MRQVYFIFAWPYVMMKFCKNLAGPCPAPTYVLIKYSQNEVPVIL